MSTDPQVTHPSHYTAHPIISGECWDYAQHLDNGAEFSAFKYFFRHGSKGKALQDVEKGIWYLQQIVDNEHLQPVLGAWAAIDSADPQQAMSHRRYAALQTLRQDIDLEKYARAQRVQQLAVQVCLRIMEGVDMSAALDTAEQVRDLIAKEQQMICDNKVALRREEQAATPADLGMVYPPLTLKHGTVHRKSDAINILHTGRVQVVYRGDNPGNVVGHTPGGRGMRTRAAIDHLINVMDLAAGIKPGAGMTLHCHTGTRRNLPVFNYHDNVTNKDDPFTPVYNDVQAAMWGIEHAMFLDWEDSKKQTDPYFRELHTYVITVN